MTAPSHPEPAARVVFWGWHSPDAVAAVRELRANGRPSLPSTIAVERACNPFLRVDAPEIRGSLVRHLGRETTDSVDAFAALRAWKDGFGG